MRKFRKPHCHEEEHFPGENAPEETLAVNFRAKENVSLGDCSALLVLLLQNNYILEIRRRSRIRTRCQLITRSIKLNNALSLGTLPFENVAFCL